jgi:hypothetical protein
MNIDQTSPSGAHARFRFKIACAAALVGAVLSTPALATGKGDCDRRADFGGPQLTILGLTAEQQLVKFRECRPERPRKIGSIYGLTGADTALVGIDFRVQDGMLYGVGNGGGVYIIDTDSAEAKRVSQLTVALNGVNFGVDFNPAADRLRIVSDNGQNLRHNVNQGGVTANDDPLDYPAPTPPNTPGPTALGVTGTAYTNNDLDATTATTQFVIDSTRNQVAVQSPPNNGTLVPTGAFNVAADAPIGFDIYTSLRDGVAAANRGFAALSVGGVAGFYRVDLLTGETILIDEFKDKVVDVAIPLDQ